ncbi:hypothetical protein N7470_000484 [Penicillium chermesinum]|nr:hypothetical protein N7470_000484 [Penicillium chermesinum]
MPDSMSLVFTSNAPKGPDILAENVLVHAVNSLRGYTRVAWKQALALPNPNETRAALVYTKTQARKRSVVVSTTLRLLRMIVWEIERWKASVFSAAC